MELVWSAAFGRIGWVYFTEVVVEVIRIRMKGNARAYNRETFFWKSREFLEYIWKKILNYRPWASQP